MRRGSTPSRGTRTPRLTAPASSMRQRGSWMASCDTLWGGRKRGYDNLPSPLQSEGQSLRERFLRPSNMLHWSMGQRVWRDSSPTISHG